MINWTRTMELCDAIGAEDFGEVVELFIEEVEAAIAALPDAAGNPALIEEQMHFLKGAALNLGFEALSDLCNAGEAAAKRGDIESVVLDDVCGCFETSKAAFMHELPNRLAA